MQKAKWIWQFGEYEIYHHKIMMCRRQEMGCDYPEVIWRIPTNEVSARFATKMHALTDTTLRFVTHSKGMVYFGDQKYPVNKDLFFTAGDYEVTVMLYDIQSFPCFFVDSEYLKSDESWSYIAYGDRSEPVACEPEFYSPNDNPAVFQFGYTRMEPVSVTEYGDGLLYDFGKELYGPVTITEYPEHDGIRLTYGESRDEALDYSEALIWEELEPGFDPIRPGRAFRYIFTQSRSKKPVKIQASLEYLPIEDIASFRCEDEQMNRIWEMCSYTFHLNSREAYLDGIKRDRWCWAGDAYQSFWANYYLYFEPQIIKRSIIALLGKPPYTTHVNTINDYSAYLIISVWDYYFATEDETFVKRIWDNLKALYGFIVSRTNEKGYVVKRDGDWIFIDWFEMDKEGILCAEQILLWKVHKVMGKLAGLMEEKTSLCETVAGKHGKGNYFYAAEQLKKNIMEDFWDEDSGLFFDYKADGRRQITRHPNIFAILYDFVPEGKKKRIAESVIYSDQYAQITTPYFKLYELIAICKLGDVGRVQEYIDWYWGGMLDKGATTTWERYDPEASREDALAMYGMKYGTSLCHAWGGGPIYLLGRYCCGVAPTDVGYRTFEVKPDFGRYREIHATVPVKDGVVKICLEDGKLEVMATVSGGTLIYGGREYELPANESVYWNDWDTTVTASVM